MKLDTNLYRIPWIATKHTTLGGMSIEWNKEFYEKFIESSYIGKLISGGYEPPIGQFPKSDEKENITITDVSIIDLNKIIGRIKRINFDDGIDVYLTDDHLKNYLIGLLETDSVAATCVYVFNADIVNKCDRLLNIFLAAKNENGEYKYI